MTQEERIVAKIERDLGAKDLLILKLSAQTEMLAERINVSWSGSL